MGVLLGFDPGGAGAFGWCIAHDGPTLPLSVHAAGVADSAGAAVRDAVANVPAGDGARAAGIDAPLFWVAQEDRRVDRLVRAAVREKGGPGSTVNHVNSLRGACLVQGVVAGVLLRQRFAGIPLTEAHPKAFLWISGTAAAGRPPRMIGLLGLSQFTVNGSGYDDHVRDAAIGCLSAWAMFHQPVAWSDLYPREADAISPLAAPLGYWMPM